MKRFATFILMIAACSAANAAERTLQQMREAAAAVLGEAREATRAAAQEAIEPLRRGRTYTVMGRRSGGGFAVIANDDACEPVLGYTLEGTADGLPCGLEWWLEATDKALERGRTDRSNMRKLIADRGLAPATGPLLKSKWSQGEPFNRLCPALPSGRHYPAGCVAVAMAQVMRHHRWPTQGTGRHEYLWATTADGKELWLEADFSSTAYRWDDMLDSYEPDSYTEAQAEAAAELMYHCGVASGMKYNEDGSGAYTVDAGLALQTYFGYNIDAAYLDRSMFEDTWMQMLYEEIDAGRPVIYEGRKLNGGDMFTADRHAFVIDGYDASGLVHVNWGWGGRADGMFRIDNLQPDDDEGYNVDQWMLCCLAPAEADVPVRYLLNIGGFKFYQNGIYMNWYAGVGNTYNYSCRTLTGRVSVIAEGDGGFYELISSAMTNAMPMHQFSLRTGSFTIPEEMPDGEYNIYPALYDDAKGQWQLLTYRWGKPDMMTATKSGNTFTDCESISTGIGSAADAGAGATGRVRVYDQAGRKVLDTDAATFSEADIPGRGLFLISCGGTVRKVAR